MVMRERERERKREREREREREGGEKRKFRNLVLFIPWESIHLSTLILKLDL